MKFGYASHQVNEYQVATPVYAGPLDLLLQLIERAELDITRLALSQVTDQYLAYMRDLDTNTAEEVSAFLVIAAKLLQIKSEALLPRPPVREIGEEDPGEALARQLLAYKRYKEIAESLYKRESSGLRTFLRVTRPPKIQAKADLSEFSLDDILLAARNAFNQADSRKNLNTVVAAPRVTIREKIAVIVASLRKLRRTSFSSLIGQNRNRLDVVVTFLAMLELVKRHFVNATQDSLFGEITLETSNSWDDDLNFEIEFGE